MVNFTLSPQQKALRANVQAFAQQVLSTAPGLYSHLPTQRERFQATLPIYQAAVKAGLIKGQIPAALGGNANSLIDAAIVVEEFYAVEPGAAITILGTGLGLTPLIIAGSKQQHEKFLTPFLEQSGQRLASFMHSEPTGTANWLEKGAPGLQTTAYREGDDWVIDGEKLWTTNSGGWDQRGADVQCVVCRQGRPNTAQDPSSNPADHILILIVTREDISNNPDSAYRIESEPELAGHRSTSGPHTRFSGFRVPAANLLSKPGQGAQIVEQTFGTSAAIVGAMGVGIMRAAFEAALKFSKEDSRGGTVKIIERQGVGERLIDIKLRVDAARAMTWRAFGLIESKEEDLTWEQRLEAALEAKVWSSDAAPKAVIEAMSVVGVQSYTKDKVFSRLLEDAVCMPLFDGGNVGVRRRQLEKIFQRDDYQPWAASF
ncbi:Nitroalkane oxidase in complex with Spermine, A competitive inhibitor [Westerdykella ornata]|uniref:Nitroalkane oxidase in complex with Spermine, A competitive inhibitor n=1 Tax=Westerdykella ornata TaxID=318751 RepID=A0A6A6JVK7_WESOR|nr:Nitroalkane oxidase in complex with Spermine, A competitive inhibitor [Westerdykella ornata]KAF2279848.1 Nitroalkane oxidase in complex with Spermine, A competitive inhibitor [Westerdykella ornata]